MAQVEINIQCEAWASVPQASKNEFTNLHTSSSGFINYQMILVSHYGKLITQKEFTDLNFGRYYRDQDWQGEGRKFDCGYFSYQFDVNGELIDIAGPYF